MNASADIVCRWGGLPLRKSASIIATCFIVFVFTAVANAGQPVQNFAEPVGDDANHDQFGCLMNYEAVQKQMADLETLLKEAEKIEGEERKNLLDRHMAVLKKNAKILRGMPGCIMMGETRKEVLKAREEAGDHADTSSIQHRLRALEMRGDLTHQLLEQLIRREALKN